MPDVQILDDDHVVRRTLVNEFGNTIEFELKRLGRSFSIVIAGPSSTADNTLTADEARVLNECLAELLGPSPEGPKS